MGEIDKTGGTQNRTHYGWDMAMHSLGIEFSTRYFYSFQTIQF